MCGGKSQRMGDDKGLLKSGNKTWAERGVEKFISLDIPFLISINASQVPSYRLHFDEGSLSIDDESITIQGPLLGLMSAHNHYPDKDILVLACDMINMNHQLLVELMTTFKNSTSKAIAFKGETIEPLCAIYSSKGLKKIFSIYQKKELQKHSMMHVLELLHAEYIPIKAEQKVFFKNYNEPADLA